MEPITDVHEAMRLIDSFKGAPGDFTLPISDELQDDIGMCMAAITDRILAKGWAPDGFEQKAGFRVYRYKPA